MELLSTLEKIIKNKNNTPTLFLFILLYLFSIDLIIIFLLGYEPKDYFILLDYQKILYYNIGIVLLFTILRKITRNAFWESAVVISILIVIYSMVYGDYSQIKNILINGIILLIFIAKFSYDFYKDSIDDCGFIAKTFIVGFVFLIFTIIIISLIYNNILKWETIYSKNNKLDFNAKISLHSLFEAKSFNTFSLHKSNTNTKVYGDNDISHIKKFIDSNYDNFINIPYDGYEYHKNKITVNYYDNDSYRIFFILNPTNCKEDQYKNNLCKKLTLITKQVNSYDTSKGYDLISSYMHEVSVEKNKK